VTRLALALALAISLPGRAAGQDPVSSAVDTERFRPTADPEGGLMLSGAGAGEPWQIDFVAWFHASRNPIVRVAADGRGRGEALLEGRVGVRLQVGWNIGKRVRLAADLPLTLHQIGVHPESGDALPSGGIGDVRLEPRVTILDPATVPFGVALAVPVSFPTGRGDALIGDPGPTIQPRVTIEGRPSSTTVRRLSFAVAADFGWRFRPKSSLAGVDAAGEFTFGVGARWVPSDRFRLGTEVVGAIGAGDTGRHAEWISWVRVGVGPKRRLDFLGGVALGLAPGVGTPEGRVFVGVRTRIDPRRRRIADATPEEEPEPERESIVRAPSPPLPETSDGVGWGLRLVGRRPSIRSRVLFELDAARITASGRDDLEVLARWLSEHPSVRRVEVRGHADRRGSHEHNDPLSVRRAQAVVDFLIGHGVGAERLAVRGFGERLPSAAGTHDSDRRVEFQVVDGPAVGFGEIVRDRPDRSYRTLGRSSRHGRRR
jgi:outer membrane protein OmpA-like peptidoglycan-associated protein